MINEVSDKSKLKGETVLLKTHRSRCIFLHEFIEFDHQCLKLRFHVLDPVVFARVLVSTSIDSLPESPILSLIHKDVLDRVELLFTEVLFEFLAEDMLIVVVYDVYQSDFLRIVQKEWMFLVYLLQDEVTRLEKPQKMLESFLQDNIFIDLALEMNVVVHKTL